MLKGAVSRNLPPGNSCLKVQCHEICPQGIHAQRYSVTRFAPREYLPKGTVSRDLPPGDSCLKEQCHEIFDFIFDKHGNLSAENIIWKGENSTLM